MASNQKENPKPEDPNNDSLYEFITSHGLNDYHSVSEVAKRAKRTEEHERIMNLEKKVESLTKQIETIKEHCKTPAERKLYLWFTESRPPSYKFRHETRRYKNETVWWCGRITEGPCDEWRNHKPSECPYLVLTNPNIHNKRKAAGATMVELPSGKTCQSPHKMIKRSDASNKK